MKKYLNPVIIFLMGFLFMASVYSLTRCSKDDDLLAGSINPDELEENIDYKSINKAGESIEDAFIASDQTAIDNLVLDESLKIFQGKEEPYSTEELAEIGKAFKRRELTTATKNYAEFTYKIDGVEYTMALACEEESVWKIIRY